MNRLVNVRMNDQNEQIVMGQINTQSLYAKMDRLVNYLSQVNVDILFLSETWEQMGKTFRMKGYRFLSKVRPGGYGGVSIAYRNAIVLQQINMPDFDFLEAVAGKTVNLDRNLILVSVYIPPAVNDDERRYASADINKLFNWVNDKSDLIVCGDWNAHARMWGCMDNCVRGNQLADCILDSDMIILNDGRPTRLANLRGTANALDLSLVSSALACQVTWNVEEENLGSDHFMIQLIMGDNRVYKRKREIMDQGKWVREMNEILGENELNENQLNSEIQRVNERCVKTVDMKDVKINGWWNKEIEYWYERKRIALREFNRNMNAENRITYARMNGRLKKAIRKVKRKRWREYVSEMTHWTTTKDVWSKFNRVRGKYLETHNVVNDFQEKGCEFMNMFMNVENNLQERECIESDTEANGSINRMFEWDEFLSVLEGSKSTTPGTNRVSYGMLRLLSTQAKQNLLKVLNKVWMDSKIPNEWKECRVVPILKRDRDPNEATNYRGICMLNVFVKLLNGMLKERIDRLMNVYNSLPNTTYGFRKGHSAIECIEKFVWEVRKENKKVIAVFLDVERAYDYVIPWKLQQILGHLKFPRKVCDWVKDFMSERKVILKGQNYRLEGVVNIGLPQGSKLSPTLFNLYTAAVHRINATDKIVLQFADDFVVIGKGRRIDQATQNAQMGVNEIIEYLTSLNLKVNPNKCAIMSFRVNNRAIDIRINDRRIEQVNVHRYLGIWIDRRLTFSKHMKYLADNCKERLNVVKRVSKPKWGSHPGVTSILCKALVSSKITYGISVYGDGAKGAFGQLMRVENACARVVLGAINSTPIHTLYSEMGDYPLNYKREWITMKETVRMMVRKNVLLNEMKVGLQRGRVYKPTYRLSVISENIDAISSIGNTGPKPLPHNLTLRMELEDYIKGMNETMIKRLFERMKSQYCEHEIVYTDASLCDDRVGVGVYLERVNVEKSVRINEGICIMNAELIAMYEGIKLAMNEGRRKIIIFTDSQSGILMLSNGGGREGNVYVDEIFEKLRYFDVDVTIQWIPSHKNIEGNERADMLAKGVLECDNIQMYEKMDARDVLRVFQENVWNKWMNEYDNLSRIKGKKYYELCSTPRKTPFYKELRGSTKMIRMIERVRLNHGNWKECLFKRHLVENNECETCGVTEDIEHILLHCTKYNSSRSNFSILRNATSLTDCMKLGGSVYKEMYEFITINRVEV